MKIFGLIAFSYYQMEIYLGLTRSLPGKTVSGNIVDFHRKFFECH